MKRGISVLLFLILVIVLSLNFISAGFFDSLKEFFNPFITGKAVDEKIGLVSHWPFENNYNDNVGNNHGSVNGNPVFIEGKVGKSLKFDGNDYIKTDIKNLDLQSAFTISAWINAESSSSFQTILAKEQDSPEGWSNRNFWFALWDNGKLTLKFSSLSNNNDCNVIGGEDLRNKGWKHVVGVYDGSNCKIYVDGILVGSDKTLSAPEGIGQPLLIGLESNYRKRGFKGAIDEVRIWNRAFSNSEVKELYDNYLPKESNAVCGNGVIETGEVCDSNSQLCIINGYFGSQLCNNQCNGWNACETKEFCGDGSRNGNEQCDDGNNINGDGCDNSCNNELKNTQCNDTIDNDGDGKIDYPSDPGCSSAEDNDESDVINATCTDSDGGKDYYVKGISNHGSVSSVDWCSTNTSQGIVNENCTGKNCILVEHYCRPASEGIEGIDTQFYNCPNVCKDGACVSGELTSYSHWQFENNYNDDVGSNHGVGAGTIFVGGKLGRAVSFDGVDDYISVINESPFDFERTDKFSIGLWLKPDVSDTSTQVPLSKMKNAAPYTGWDFVINYGGGRNAPGKLDVQIISVNGLSNRIEVATRGTTKLNDGNYHYYVITYDGSSKADGVKIYEDSVALALTVVKNTLTSTTLNNNKVTFGDREGGGTALSYKGSVDEVKIWKRVLSDEEIKNEYEQGSKETKPLNITISLATLKDNFDIGEKIKLTDPPDTIRNNPYIKENNPKTIERNFLREDQTASSFSGYIVEFEDNPIIVEKENVET